MMKKYFYIVAIILLASVLSCEQFFNPIDPDESIYGAYQQGNGEIRGETVYFTSFESADDILGWMRFSTESLTDNPAPGGGKKSLRIGGGCIMPTAYLDLKPLTEGGYYKISCWGKPDVGQGSIILTIAGEEFSNRPEARIRVKEDGWTKYWTKYNSSESIYCPAGTSLRIEIMCGGIAGGSMFMDELSVIRVN